MKYTEKEVRSAIVKKNDSIVSEVATQLAELKLANFAINEDLKAKAIEVAVKDNLKHYKRFDTKKDWAKAIPYINRITFPLREYPYSLLTLRQIS